MLKTAKKAKAGQTDRQTDRRTDEVTYRVALHATKNWLGLKGEEIRVVIGVIEKKIFD